MKLNTYTLIYSFTFWNRSNETVLWIVKPPNKSKGTGIKVISNSIEDIPNYPTCIQKYVTNPLLINGYKVFEKIKKTLGIF